MTGHGGGRPHPLGFCTCRTHLRRAWHRPEHWRADEVAYLEAQFGRQPDEQIARHLHRSIVGLRLKAKRLGLHKRDAGLSARDVAKLFGVDPTTVARHWIAPGLLPARRGHVCGTGRRVWIVDEDDITTFVRRHPWYVDQDKVPRDSWVRDLLGERWYSLPEIHRLTGRMTVAEVEIKQGLVRAAKRGTHWYVPASDLPKIRHLSPSVAAESAWRRDQVLRVRRNRRKGVAA